MPEYGTKIVRRVDGALQVDEQFQEDQRANSLMWAPIFAYLLTALDWFGLFFNQDFADRFLGGDASGALLGGLVVGGAFTVVTIGFWIRRRWAWWWLPAALGVEFLMLFAFAGFEWTTFELIRVPLFNVEGAGLYFFRTGVFLILPFIAWALHRYVLTEEEA